MPVFKYAKLVRDKIWSLERAAGHIPHGRRLGGLELKRALLKKLSEEAAEVPLASAAQNEVAEELADLQQVLDDLAAEYGISKETIETAQQMKRAEKGGFREGYYIETVEIPDENDPFAVKFRENPKKYPEVL